MAFNKSKINLILSKILMGLGIVFLLYVGYMYFAYYCTDWRGRIENVKGKPVPGSEPYSCSLKSKRFL